MNTSAEAVPTDNSFLDEGNREIGYRFVNWLEQNLQTPDINRLGFDQSELDLIYKGEKGVPAKTIREVLSAFQRRYPLKCESDSDYQFFKELVDEENDELPTALVTVIEPVLEAPPVVVLTAYPKRPTLVRHRCGFWTGPDW